MIKNVRTDLADEARQLVLEDGELSEIAGVSAKEEDKGGFRISTVTVTSGEGERAIGKKKGKYVTMELGRLIRRDDGAFFDAVSVLAEELRGMLKLSPEDSVLLVGLGNDAITPDSVGPKTLKNCIVTRHLPDSMPETFRDLRRVSAIETGVLGTTGIESAEIVRAVCRETSPASVVAIDAICSRSLERLCTTVQLTDTGIVPGSGIGNARQALDAKALGVPVIAVGVPTVVDAATIASGLRGEEAPETGTGMIVTPREIDERTAAISKLLGYAVSMALLDGLTVEDIAMMLE